MAKTRHPCAGMTAAQRRDFELIASDEPPLSYLTIKALEARGLIEEVEPTILRRDRFGHIKIKQWRVPLHHHAQWCQWASEQSDPLPAPPDRTFPQPPNSFPAKS